MFIPKSHGGQAIEEIVRALRGGRTEVLDAGLSKYFDTIPHRALLWRNTGPSGLVEA